MNVIVTALKLKLAPFGWTEQVKRDQKTFQMSAVSCRRCSCLSRCAFAQGMQSTAACLCLPAALPHSHRPLPGPCMGAG